MLTLLTIVGLAASAYAESPRFVREPEPTCYGYVTSWKTSRDADGLTRYFTEVFAFTSSDKDGCYDKEGVGIRIAYHESFKAHFGYMPSDPEAWIFDSRSDAERDRVKRIGDLREKGWTVKSFHQFRYFPD